jgi:phosphoribosylamine-glycine ligase
MKHLMQVKEIFDGKFGKAENVLIEEFLEGEEMSYFIITDGKTYKNLVLLKIINVYLREI